MERYEIYFRKSVLKDFPKIPAKDRERIVQTIRQLERQPRPPQAKKLSGREKYRLRCGVYRVLYEIQEEKLVVCVVKVRHRKDVYR